MPGWHISMVRLPHRPNTTMKSKVRIQRKEQIFPTLGVCLETPNCFQLLWNPWFCKMVNLCKTGVALRLRCRLSIVQRGRTHHKIQIWKSFNIVFHRSSIHKCVQKEHMQSSKQQIAASSCRCKYFYALFIHNFSSFTFIWSHTYQRRHFMILHVEKPQVLLLLGDTWSPTPLQHPKAPNLKFSMNHAVLFGNSICFTSSRDQLVCSIGTRRGCPGISLRPQTCPSSRPLATRGHRWS